MAKNYPFPAGPLIDPRTGAPTPAGIAYLRAIETITKDINAVANLDGATSYTNDELRDKIIAVISALQG